MAFSNTIWPNIPRLLTAIAEWLACIQVVLMFTHHRLRWPNALILVACLLGQVFLQIWCGTWPIAFWILGIIINIAWMLLTILANAPDAGWRRLFYGLCRAFVLAETFASVTWQALCMTLLPLRVGNGIIFFWSLVDLLILFAFFFFTQRKFTIENISVREDAVAALTAMIVFAISNVGFISSNVQTFFGGSAVIFTIRSFVDICGVLMLTLEDRQRMVNNLRNDLTTMNQMMESQYQQYQEYKQSSELVNQHFHDLKHQLTVLVMEDDSKKRQQYLDEISEDIHMYNVGVKTGNKIADVILTRKNAYFKQHHIIFTCIANGALLNMINTMDLCSLLGNSLDNATESVEKIKDPEKRMINLRIVNKGNFIIYQVENYTLANQDFTDLPKTTKRDKSRHGYGLKSIRRIAHKYNGTMTVGIKDHWFRLTVMFNRPAEAKATSNREEETHD